MMPISGGPSRREHVTAVNAMVFSIKTNMRLPLLRLYKKPRDVASVLVLVPSCRNGSLNSRLRLRSPTLLRCGIDRAHLVWPGSAHRASHDN